jgi:hypothetical protein
MRKFMWTRDRLDHIPHLKKKLWFWITKLVGENDCILHCNSFTVLSACYWGIPVKCKSECQPENLYFVLLLGFLIVLPLSVSRELLRVSGGCPHGTQPSNAVLVVGNPGALPSEHGVLIMISPPPLSGSLRNFWLCNSLCLWLGVAIPFLTLIRVFMYEGSEPYQIPGGVLIGVDVYWLALITFA